MVLHHSRDGKYIPMVLHHSRNGKYIPMVLHHSRDGKYIPMVLHLNRDGKDLPRRKQMKHGWLGRGAHACAPQVGRKKSEPQVLTSNVVFLVVSLVHFGGGDNRAPRRLDQT